MTNVIGSVGVFSASYTKTLADLRASFDQLQLQLATGSKSTDYAGLGKDGSLALSLQGKLTAFDSYKSSADIVSLRLNMMQTTLTGLTKSTSDVRGVANTSTFQLANAASTVGQGTAKLQLDAVVDMLNANVGGRYLFGGREVESKPVATSATIMDGSVGMAGFNAVVAERKAADLGTGTGRLDISQPTASSVMIASDSATPHPFGFKIAEASATVAGANVNVTNTVPRSAEIDLTQQPIAGDTVKLRLELPDGSFETVTLTAVSGPAQSADEFSIGTDVATTAANLSSALTGAIRKMADTALVAASALSAAKSFFSSDPPQRVDIPTAGTAASATGLRSGAADTVRWYQGDPETGSARNTQVARVNETSSVAYGMRANESAIAETIGTMAAFAAVRFDDGTANGAGRYDALRTRVSAELYGAGGNGPVETLSIEVANIQNTVAASSERREASRNVLQTMYDGITTVDPQDVATQILALQTRLQASYQTTSLLSKLSLVNYL